jgi:hypothetical protein
MYGDVHGEQNSTFASPFVRASPNSAAQPTMGFSRCSVRRDKLEKIVTFLSFAVAGSITMAMQTR